MLSPLSELVASIFIILLYPENHSQKTEQPQRSSRDNISRIFDAPAVFHEDVDEVYIHKLYR